MVIINFIPLIKSLIIDDIIPTIFDKVFIPDINPLAALTIDLKNPPSSTAPLLSNEYGQLASQCL